MFNFKYKNADGLWVKTVTLTHHNDSMPAIVLLPMIHVADKRYFEEMYYEEWCCDVVLLEGVRHPFGRILNKFYEAFGALKNIGARAQNDPSLRKDMGSDERPGDGISWHSPRKGAPEECISFIEYPDIGSDEMKRAVRFVLADVSAETARDSLKVLPWWTYVAAPFALIGALIMMRFKSRSEMIGWMRVEGPAGEIEGKGALGAAFNTFLKFAIDTRDNHLANILLDEIKSPANAGKTIGIKFGVGHMPPLIKMLRKTLGYTIAGKRGVLAWAIDPKAQDASPDRCYGVAMEKYYDIMLEPSRKRQMTPASVE